MKRFILTILVLLSMQQSAAAADRVRIGYSSISGAYTPIWVAHDAGYFAKEGLQDDIILIPSGTQLAQVTVAGEIDIGSLNGSSAIAAALSGADLENHEGGFEMSWGGTSSCGEAFAAQEQAFLGLLAATTSHAVNRYRLTLMGPAGGFLESFHRPD